jgi:MFS family permease
MSGATSDSTGVRAAASAPAPESASPRTPPQPPARHALLADRNFRWLLAASVVSLLGDQFTLIALPWLVLKLTGDALTLGAVIAVMSVPRAAFVLFGGAVVDRRSPQRVLLLAKLANAALLALLAVLVWHGSLALPALYTIAAAIGLATAFSYPASSALLPQAVAPELLPGANGLSMGLQQAIALVGPMLAGALVGLHASAVGPGVAAGAAHAIADGRGLTLAFGLDALSFVLSACALLPVRLRARGVAAPGGMLDAIGETLRAFWRDRALRTLCAYFAAVSFFVGGPIQVALPVLVDRRLPGGAAALGLLSAGHGVGVLAGMILAGARPGWRLRTLGTTMLAIDMLSGAALVAFGRIETVLQGVLLLVALGAFAGFVQVAVMSWIQRRVPAAMLGRAMSVLLFIFLGLAPLSAAAAGAALRWLAPATLFGAAGLALAALALLGLAFTSIRDIRDAGATDAPAPTSTEQGGAVDTIAAHG